MMNKANQSPARRTRGSIYLAVLGICLIVVTLAVGGILATRVQSRTVEGEANSGEARLCAQSGLELAKLWISQDANWRTTRPHGEWCNGLSLGNATLTVSVVDPVDNSLSNRPHDAVTLTVRGQAGQSRQTLSATLAASPLAIPALSYSAHTAGQIRVRSGRRVVAGTGIFSANGSIRNEGTIEGTVDAGSIHTAGIVYGGITTGNAARSTPATTIADLYVSLGTEVSSGATIEKRVLGPGINPWGTANADGVYVIRPTADLLIRNSRIYGTLVIICPGKKVTLDGAMVMDPARSDFPALIVIGNLEISSYGQGAYLSEATNNTNFNPAGAPFNGASDTDKSDLYATALRGLIYASGTVSIKSNAYIKGALISAATGSDAIDIDADPSIAYDPALATNPPQGFTSSVPMIQLGGSVKQVVD